MKDIPVIGPKMDGAILEGSKDFSKQFMIRNGVPTARYQSFSKENLNESTAFLDSLKPPYVLKADGLAAGKGVLILHDLAETKKELDNMLNGKFGTAGNTVVIEEFLHGIELSVFVLTDGISYKLLPEAKDYKRIGDNDEGLNTGGMGAISPVPFVDKAFLDKVEEKIVKTTIAGLRKEQIDYRGFIFIGLMNCDGEPVVIEYNCRMGDPETEVVIPRIKSDFLELLEAVGNQTLEKKSFEIDARICSTVMLVAGGYPEEYEKGKVISGLDNSFESLVFHAGTKQSENAVVTNGGRVIAVSSYGKNINEAVSKSYASIQKIKWENMYFRKDIGKDLLKYESVKSNS